MQKDNKNSNIALFYYQYFLFPVLVLRTLLIMFVLGLSVTGNSCSSWGILLSVYYPLLLSVIFIPFVDTPIAAYLAYSKTNLINRHKTMFVLKNSLRVSVVALFATLLVGLIIGFFLSRVGASC